MKSKTKEIHFFDFDGTITNYQTPDNFVLYVLTHQRLRLKLLIAMVLESRLVSFLTRKSCFSKKQIFLGLIKGINKSKLELLAEKYYNDVIKQSLRKETVSLLKKINKHKDSNAIWVVSAGYSIYIDKIKKDFNINKVIANDFLYENNIFTGKLLKKDCYGTEKASRIIQELKPESLPIDNTTAYSDCLSDQPLFDISKNNYFFHEETFRKI